MLLLEAKQALFLIRLKLEQSDTVFVPSAPAAARPGPRRAG